MEARIVEVLKCLNQKEISQANSILESLIRQDSKNFIHSQNSFAYNISGRLVHLLTEPYDPIEAIALLKMIRGVCLLHRPSRSEFNGKLNLIIPYILNTNYEIQEACVYAIVAILVHNVKAIREIEQTGLKVLCTQFKNSKTTKPVKLAILQFLFFYLIPETQSQPPMESRKTTKEKQLVLGQYLSNVDGLVRELETNKPFGEGYIEW